MVPIESSCSRILAMAAPPVVFPPPPWTNQDIVLYHGTIDLYAPAIVAGVSVGMGKPYRDFGPGFYTTTLLTQAQTWAAEIAATKPPGTATPAVIKLTVPRDALAELDTLAFVRGDFNADDFWSFVPYCRRGATDHRRGGPPYTYYDIVYGPVAAFWNQRSTIYGADQISFHTRGAQDVLNACARGIL